MNFELMAPCHFGIETVLKREIYDLGYEIKKVEDGHVFYEADEDGIVVSNLCLRTAERVLIVTGRFCAKTYEEFFQGMKNIPWEKYLPSDAAFWVTKATSVKSRLYSTTDLQRVGKRAMVARMQGIYHMDRFPETGSDYPVRIFIYKDQVTVTIDTSGDALHKRGYRKETGKAPISETIAAALIMLTPWKADRILADPFCGSGTIPIEAALIAANIAPGLYRHFAAEGWTNLIDKKLWTDERKWLREAVDTDVDTRIYGSDIDPDMIRIANENARRAGVKKLISFKRLEAGDFRMKDPYGFIITNPPYGERLSEKDELPELYSKLFEAYRRLDKWSLFVITAWEDATRCLGGKPSKNRKIYNGMLKTYFYQYMGPKPPKVTSDGKN
ncbi:MAG: class I SAM-dependent RNA methyltransferase [Lachnospiraceae bacterium]|uniref:Class I SAM-dependent RNA methyltransferase n=1 Tax=Candidatus Weimeria bifida TaxID=2599074 RepID=A0A6N7J1Z8_9FIRM|nr:class I SAM-dependent RNA methyltransferase [Candidatus Weimeria bifida]RRF96561.1 MAG: class I SAM-dependent RNA methyltransferase [Lachnospiraceae bacterium]